jgi:hypothetical protein
MAEPNLTDRQQRWFASIREGLERDTGKTMEEWVAIARTCPETAHRARLKWFKETHGLLQNRASQVIGEAFGSKMSWSEPDALIDQVWADPAARAIFEAIDASARALPEVLRTARRGYTAWSRRVQFAAAKPIRGGVQLGVAAPLDLDARLAPRGGQSWSERLGAQLTLTSPADIDQRLTAILKAAWDGA